MKRFIMELLPPTVREHARELRSLSGRARRMHLSFALRRLAFPGPSTFAVPAGSRTRILFVCHGNIIRSALAEALFRKHFESHAAGSALVRSAGTSTVDGRPADPRAAAAARDYGVDLTAHRSTRMTPALVTESDLIFVMDRLNEAEVVARFPDARGKVKRLGALAPHDADADVIPDPYALGPEAVAASAARIDTAVRKLTVLLRDTTAGDPR